MQRVGMDGEGRGGLERVVVMRRGRCRNYRLHSYRDRRVAMDGEGRGGLECGVGDAGITGSIAIAIASSPLHRLSRRGEGCRARGDGWGGDRGMMRWGRVPELQTPQLSG